MSEWPVPKPAEHNMVPIRNPRLRRGQKLPSRWQITMIDKDGYPKFRAYAPTRSEAFAARERLMETGSFIKGQVVPVFDE